VTFTEDEQREMDMKKINAEEEMDYFDAQPEEMRRLLWKSPEEYEDPVIEDDQDFTVIEISEDDDC